MFESTLSEPRGSDARLCRIRCCRIRWCRRSFRWVRSCVRRSSVTRRSDDICASKTCLAPLFVDIALIEARALRSHFAFRAFLKCILVQVLVGAYIRFARASAGTLRILGTVVYPRLADAMRKLQAKIHRPRITACDDKKRGENR